MVVVGTGGIGTKYIKTDWPIEEGTTAGTTKTHGRDHALRPLEGSNVPERDKEGLE